MKPQNEELCRLELVSTGKHRLSIPWAFTLFGGWLILFSPLFHQSGPVVSNVIGSLNPRYGLFGDTVNTASRMETNSEAGKILCSHASAEILKVQAPSLAIKLRGKIKVKGKGQMMTYWVGNTGYSSKPNLVPILDVSESGSASEITMEASNTLHVGALNTRSVDDHSFGTKETDDWLSIGDSDRYQVQANLDSKKNVHLAKISGALIESLRELVASRGENNTVSRHEKEYIKRLENEIGGEGTVLGEMVDCIPFYKSKITHLDPFDVELSKLVEQQVRDFVEACAGLYSSEHKFHGIFHALHVCSSAKAMLSRIDCGDDPSSDRSYGIADDKLAQFTVMFSALIHDLDHRGVPNFCLSEEDPELRTRYRGKAIAEQNSVDLGWELLMAPKYADLRACIYTSGEEMIRFRKVLVNIVIATDIFDPDLSKRRDDRWKRAFDPEHWTRSFGSAKAEDDSLKATVILELLMQASDIAHTMQHWHVYKTWNQKLFEEMYAAYVAGRFPKDPSENWYKGEIDFFDKKVIPLAKELKDTEVFGDFSDEYLQFATENREHWEAEGNTLVQNMVKKVKMGGKKAGLKI